MSERVEIPLVPCEHNRQWWESWDGDADKQARIALMPCNQCMVSVFVDVARSLGQKFAAEREQQIIDSLLGKIRDSDASGT